LNVNIKYFVSQATGLSTSDFTISELLKKSLDARQKRAIKWNYTVLIETTAKLSDDYLEYILPQPYISPQITLSNPHPFIIGSGPAGLFAALELVEKGFSPYLFEQGDELDIRAKKVNDFWKTSILDEKSNVQFGEGGAGTFSDGKLTARNQDYYSKKVLINLIRFGAPASILYNALPHLGTDGIRQIVRNIRDYLSEKGCKFFFRHQLEDIQVRKNVLISVRINGNKYQPEALFLAIGNAARNTYSMLEKKIPLASKPFAVGFRIEHPQAFINQMIYGKNAPLDLLGNATYRFTDKFKNRGIYSFCMCPGGFVIAGNSAPNQVVTNGMSFQARNNRFANSAIVVTVKKEDFEKHTLAGINFQKKIEAKAFNPAIPYAAPCQSAFDFVNNGFAGKRMENSYRPQTYAANLQDFFPDEIRISLQKGLLAFAKKMPGFIRNGVLIAPETRTSSPVRILRDKHLFYSLQAQNLFPIGEGSGYSGGIVSSAADGIKAASIIHQK